MTSHLAAHTSDGPSRRTVAKTAAWAVPAVTVAAAAPTLAASTATIDLALEAQPFGDGITTYSPDRLQMAQLTLIGGFNLTNLGSQTAPAGSVVTLSFDQRLFTGATLQADGEALTATGSAPARQASDNLTEVSFALPMEIPAGGLVNLRPGLTGAEELPWATDFEPYTVAVAPAEGSADAVVANNSVTTEVRYVDTQDAALTVTWREHLLTTADGDPLPINVQDALTVTANAPGDLPKGTMLTIGGPTVNDGTDWTTAFEGATIVTALLDGVDVADQISQDPVAPGDDVFTWRINVVIPAGQSLVIDVDVDVTTQTRRSVYDGAWSQVLSTGDRDESNNRADTGPYPTR